MSEDIFELAKQLLDERNARGVKTYYKPLTVDCVGKDFFQEAIEEQADGLIYMIKAKYDRDKLVARIAELEAQLERYRSAGKNTRSKRTSGTVSDRPSASRR